MGWLRTLSITNIGLGSQAMNNLDDELLLFVKLKMKYSLASSKQQNPYKFGIRVRNCAHKHVFLSLFNVNHKNHKPSRNRLTIV